MIQSNLIKLMSSTEIYNNEIDNDSYQLPTSIALTDSTLDDLELIAPEPSQLRVIIMVCQMVLKSHINLDLIAKELVLNDEILGKKMPNVIEEGILMTPEVDPTIKKRKPMVKKQPIIVKKVKTTTHTDFSNQLSVVINPKGSDVNLNLKVFGPQGKIIITGVPTIDYAHRAMTIFKNSIQHLKHNYQIDMKASVVTLFNQTDNYIKFITKHYLILLQLFSLFGLNLDLKLDIILNTKMLNKFQLVDPITDIITETDLHTANFSQLIDNRVLINGTDQDLINYAKMIQVFNICLPYFPNHEMMTHLNDSHDHLHTLITQLYEGQMVSLPVTLTPEQFQIDRQITIENYITQYNCNYRIDQTILTQILNAKWYRQVTAKYLPTEYPGINVKYISRVDCQPTCQSSGQKKKTKCPCKEISFLIFESGKIHINGCRSWKQSCDGYQLLTNILKTEYHQIVLQDTNEQKIEKMPAQIIEQVDGFKYVYINKKQQIIENPPNYFILKKHGLLNHYLI